jgi:lipopolysaccharide exporter
MRWRALQLVGVQAIGLLRLLILAKLLAPEAFGLLAIAFIAINVVTVLGDLGLLPALVQQRNATRNQHDGAWTVGVLLAACFALILCIAAPVIAQLFNEPLATPIIAVLAFRPLIDAFTSIGVVQLTRDLKFKELALINLPAAVVDLIVAVSTAPTLGVWALVAGTMAGSLTSVVVSYGLAPHRPRWFLGWAEIAPLVTYGRWVLATGIIGLIGPLLTQMAISRMLGAAALGMYFIAMRTAFVPLHAASTVMGAVGFPMYAGLRDDLQGSTYAFSAMLAALCLVLVPTYGIVFVLAPMFEEVLGPQWIGTAPIIQLVSIASVIGILNELLAPLLMGRGRADRAFVLEGTQVVVLLVAIVPCLALFGVTGAAVAWIIGNSAAMVLAAAWIRSILPTAISSARRRMLAGLVAGIGGASTAHVVVGGVGGLGGLVMTGAAGVAVAACALWLLDWSLRLNLLELIRIFVKGGTE